MRRDVRVPRDATESLAQERREQGEEMRRIAHPDPHPDHDEIDHLLGFVPMLDDPLAVAL